MQDLLLMFIQIKTTSIKMQYNLLIYHMVLIIFRASNLFILYLPHGNIMGEISSLLSVCLGSISSETAEQMWLKFCIKVVCPGHCILRFGGSHLRCPSTRATNVRRETLHQSCTDQPVYNSNVYDNV